MRNSDILVGIDDMVYKCVFVVGVVYVVIFIDVCVYYKLDVVVIYVYM